MRLFQLVPTAFQETVRTLPHTPCALEARTAVGSAVRSNGAGTEKIYRQEDRDRRCRKSSTKAH
jgi:hypothetical protein